ncbi:MAG: hypothetical protein ACFN0Z_00620 [Parascardovia denticolens]
MTKRVGTHAALWASHHTSRQLPEIHQKRMKTSQMTTIAITAERIIGM